MLVHYRDFWHRNMDNEYCCLLNSIHSSNVPSKVNSSSVIATDYQTSGTKHAS